MPRPRSAPTTRLGQALVVQRKDRALANVAEDVGLSYMTLSRLERGTHRPSADTALKLAEWLNWTVEEVILAANRPPAEVP